MTSLNVDVPSELMDRVQIAKALTKKPIRIIAHEALESWLREHGLTPDRIPKLKGKQ